MPTIKIVNFMGEVPRLPARALGDNAQVNENLLATSSEFRPLASDGTVGTAPVGTKTLYRFSSAASNFIAITADANFVRTQLNDDQTDRTFFSSNVEPSTAPVEVSSTSATLRPLGVPFPVNKPGVAIVPPTTTPLTKDVVDGFLTGTLIPQASNALRAGITDTLLPPLALYGTTVEVNSVTAVVSAAVADALGQGTNTKVLARALPLWAAINGPTITSLLQAIPSPQSSSTKFFDAASAEIIKNGIADLFNPAGALIQAPRRALDGAIKAFADACAGVADGDGFPSVVPYEAVRTDLTGALLIADRDQRNADITNYEKRLPPTAPSEPAVPVIDEALGKRDPLWDAWEVKNARYLKDLAAFNNIKPGASTEVATAAAAIKKAQTECIRYVEEIERIYTARKQSINALVGEYLTDIISTRVNSGTIKLDADPVPDARFYIYTYVTDRGEESAPSPVSAIIEPTQYDGVRLTVVANTTANIVGYRVYRSNTASNGSEFQLVAPLSGTGLDSVAKFNGDVFEHFKFTLLNPVDGLKSESLGEVCPTTTWLPPPSRTSGGVTRHIKGFVNMPNGIVAGFIDNFVAFCEPYTPYAWPVEYQVTVNPRIVGLGVFGQTLFVGTEAEPYLISGSDSSTMSAERLSFQQACVSHRSIVSTGDGVIYASPDGLCMVGSGGAQVITDALFSREDWQALNPSSVVAAVHDRVYYFSYSGNGGGTYALDFVAKKLNRADFKAEAFFHEGKTDSLFFVQGGLIRQLASATPRRQGKWRSSRMVSPQHAPLAWVQVDGDQSTTNPATVRWFGDGQLRHTAVFTNTLPQRLPAGRWLEHEVEVESKARVTKVMLAGSTQELQSA